LDTAQLCPAKGLGTLARVYQFILGLSRKSNAGGGRGAKTSQAQTAGASEESEEVQVE